ncbi:hypothetical protein AGOR_G00127960 [Albula goreensis]|uniref:Coiled-coil domain-containing protein 150 n=1 Tax=Albula goreensis TaxID=1534307 RepID=A0A8T3DHJ5_9TELE|nr:hypothetical protein AGOR_G00127960 [Albula goreensis]
MSRASIQPLNVGATAPETLSVLQQRLQVAEEQAEALIQDMGSLGVTREQVLDSPSAVREACQRPVSPVRVWRAMGGLGGESVLWRNCEELVSRVCRLESILHSLKLTIFRMETERELNPSHPAQVVEQLSALQKEREEEQRAARKEVMQIQDQLWQACQERDEALDEARNLQEALEVSTTSKMNVALAAEELKVVKAQMADKLQELRTQLSEEANRRLETEQSQDALLQRVKDMEGAVELERERVHVLQMNCQTLQNERHEVRQVLRGEAERASQLEKQCQQLRDKADAKDSIVSQLTDELKSTRLAIQRLQRENSKLLQDESNLKTAADKVQGLNAQLEGQCSELSAALRSMTVENARLVADHQAELKAERERVLRQLQDQDLLLDAARRNIQAELQGALKDRLRLQKEIEALRSDHQQLQQSSKVAQETAATQREVLESTINRLQGQLSGSGKKESVKRERDRILTEIQSVVSNLEMERNSLQTELTKAKSREVQLHLELEAVTDSKQQFKRTNTLEKLHTRASADAIAYRSRCHKLEQKLTQVEASLEQKEEDFALAVVARDEAQLEYQALKAQVCQLEEELRGRDRVAQTLQGVLASHSRLKSSTETLQAELGGREEEVTFLRKERVQIQQDLEGLQAQVEKLQDDLMITHTEMEPLRKALETVSLDNKQLAQNLEQALLANNKLLSKLSRAQDQHESLQSQNRQLLSQREEELRETREEVKWLTNHLDSLKEQLKKEKSGGKRMSSKEVTELKKTLEEASSRSGDLSRANRELREKVGELEKVVSNQKARIKDLNIQMKQHLENRAALANSQRMKEMEETLKGLEILKDEYHRRNNEQGQLIQQFQCELKRLSSTQEGELEAERGQRQALLDKCQRLEENMRILRQSRDEAEARLREASLESQQITENLVEAHSWFRSKFNSLKKDLEKTRPSKEVSSEKLVSMESSNQDTLSTSTEGENKVQSSPALMDRKQNHWSTTLHRWETKRELARLSARCRQTGDTDTQAK